MNNKKDKTGVWIELEPGVKQILDFLCSLKAITRKSYTTNVIEAAIVAEVSDTLIFKQAITSVVPEVGKAFAELEKRVFARSSGIEPEPKQEAASDYEEELAEPVDLPHEVIP